MKKIRATLKFTAAFLTRAKPWKQPKCEVRKEWVKKMWLYTQQTITQY